MLIIIKEVFLTSILSVTTSIHLSVFLTKYKKTEEAHRPRQNRGCHTTVSMRSTNSTKCYEGEITMPQKRKSKGYLSHKTRGNPFVATLSEFFFWTRYKNSSAPGAGSCLHLAVKHQHGDIGYWDYDIALDLFSQSQQTLADSKSCVKG